MQRLSQRMTLPLIMLIALGLRLFHNSAQGYSLDESASLFYAGSPDWRALFWDNHPIFYHVLLKLWLGLTPMTEAWTRGFSALVSTAGVYVMAQIGEVHGSKRRGLAMALALTFSVVSIHYAQETRMYALFECASAFHLLASLSLAQHDSRRARVIYVSSAVLVLGTHLLGFVPFLVSGFLIALRRPKLRQLVALVGAVVILTVSGLLATLRWSALEWQWRVKQTLGIDANAIDLFKPYAQNTWVVAAVMAVAMTALWFSRDVWSRRLRRTLLALSGSAAIFVVIVAWVTGRNLYLPRYFIFFNPCLIFLFVLGLESLGEFKKITPPSLRRALASGGLLIFVAFFSSAYAYVTPAWREVAAEIVKQGGRIVWTTRTKGLAYPYYVKAGIPVQTFTYDEQTIDLLKKSVVKNDVWVVDGLVGRYSYFEALSRDLTRLGLQLSAHEFDNGFAEPVFALRILKDTAAESRVPHEIKPTRDSSD